MCAVSLPRSVQSMYLLYTYQLAVTSIFLSAINLFSAIPEPCQRLYCVYVYWRRVVSCFSHLPAVHRRRHRRVFAILLRPVPSRPHRRQTCSILEARADCRFRAWHHASVPRPIVRIVPARRSHQRPTCPFCPIALLPILCGFAHRSEAIRHSTDAIYFPTARADPSGPGAFPRLWPAAFGSGGHLWCSGPEDT